MNYNDIDFRSRQQTLDRSLQFSGRTVRMAEIADGELPELRWAAVRGITDYAKEETPKALSAMMERILTGLHRVMPNDGYLGFKLTCDGQCVHVSIGCENECFGVLTAALTATYPGINLLNETETALTTTGGAPLYGGILTGYPMLGDDDKGVSKSVPADTILRGMGSRKYAITIYAKKMHPLECSNLMDVVLNEQSVTVPQIETSMTLLDGRNTKKVNTAARDYNAALDSMYKMLHNASIGGLWETEVIYSAQYDAVAKQLGGLMCATLSAASEEALEPVLCREIENTAFDENARQVCAGEVFVTGVDQGYQINRNSMATCLGSRELAALMCLPMHEYAGYFVDRYVDFDVDNRPGNEIENGYELGDIVRTCQENGGSEGIYQINSQDLTRHVLIIGLTGGGKTNTSKSLLSTLWRDLHVPFLVIESAKREYWELSGLTDMNGNRVFPDINVFTVGDENPDTASPFRLNPMEAMPGVSLQTHIDNLQSTFKAAFELYPPMPYVLETAVYKVYEDRGWDIVTGKNRFGSKRYPMLEDLKQAVVDVTDSLNYDKEVASNVKAALTARIQSLMVGAKNLMMNTQNSISVDYLLSRPTVLELEDLGDDDTKAFVIGALLTRIYEYRKAKQYERKGKDIGHVIVVEEAHRLLKNVPEGGEGNQTRAKAVEFFCNMLAEIRSYGQGFIIADQVPTKLAPDTLKNTNLKIIHRTVAEEDRLAVGRAMNMTEDQIGYLSALRVGHAAVFSEGDNRPKLVRFPCMDSDIVDRSSYIHNCSERIRKDCADSFCEGKKRASCKWCDHWCFYEADALRVIDSLGGIGETMQSLENTGFSGKHEVDDNVRAIRTFGDFYMTDCNRNVLICVLGILMDQMSIDRNTQAKILKKTISEEA